MGGGGEDGVDMFPGVLCLIDADEGLIVIWDVALRLQVEADEADFFGADEECGVEDAALHGVVFPGDFEVWLGGGKDGETGEEGEVADTVGTAGVVDVGQGGTCLGEHGLDFPDIGEATDFAEAEDIGL